MTKTRSHYPVTIHVLTVVGALGLARLSPWAFADGWVPIAAGVTASSGSLARLHMILDRRRAGVDLRLLRLDGPPLRRRRP